MKINARKRRNCNPEQENRIQNKQLSDTIQLKNRSSHLYHMISRVLWSIILYMHNLLKDEEIP